jgi:hypothetical protein
MKLVWLIKECLKEMYIKVHIGKILSDAFLIQNGMKQGDALSPLLFGFALEYAITMVQEIQEGFKLNGPHQFLAHADSVNILDKNINACCHSFQNLLFCLIYRN